jgi:chromosome segregation ATPase
VELRGEVKKNKSEMDGLDAEFAEVEERLKFKENDLELVTNKLKSLLGEKVELETQIETLKTENYELGSLLGLSKADLTKINKSNEGLKSETARLHENLRNRDIEVDRLQGLVKDHVNTIETWRDDLERLETQSRQQAETEHVLRTEIGKKTEDLDSLRIIYEESKDEESRLLNLNKSLGLEVTDYLEAMEKTREKNRRQGGVLMELEKSNQELKIDNSRLDLELKSSLAESKSLNSSLTDAKILTKDQETTIDLLQTDLNRKTDEVKDRDSKLANLSRNIADSVEENSKLKVKLDSKSDDINKLNFTVHQAEKATEKAGLEVFDLNLTLDRLTKDVENLTGDLGKKREERDSLSYENSEKSREIERLLTELSALKKSHDTLVLTDLDLKKENDDLEDRNINWKRENDRLETVLDQIRKENERASKKNTEITRVNEKLMTVGKDLRSAIEKLTLDKEEFKRASEALARD